MKKIKNFKKSIIFLVFIILALLFFFVSKNSGSGADNQLPTKKITIVPRQFSDRYVTENAKVADERFRNFAILDKNSLLSNVINSWLKTDEVLSDNSFEEGTWLWTPMMLITPEYRDEIILGAKQNGINVIYLSIDSYLDIYVMTDGEEKERQKEKFKNILRDFIRTANQSGIKVDAEAGWQNWAMEEHLYKPGAILDFVINWNKVEEYKFRGFQYDVESYLLPEFKNNSVGVLSDFLDLISQSVTKLHNSGLEFSIVIPEFYDGTYEEAPKFFYKFSRGSVLEHLLKILERRKGSKVIIMSYRNYSQGPDGTIEISQDEMNQAKDKSTKIIIAQETGNFPPPNITFYGKTKARYERELALVYKAFEKDINFGGIAVHYINTFLELK